MFTVTMFFIYFSGVMEQVTVKPVAAEYYSDNFTSTFLFQIHLTSTDLLRHRNVWWQTQFYVH